MKNAAVIYLSKWPKDSDTYKSLRGGLAKVASILGDEPPETFDWSKLRYEDVRAVPALLKQEEKLKPPTINLALSALRGVLETAWRTGQIPDEAYRRIEIKNVNGKSLPAGRALSASEMDTIALRLKAVDAHDAAVVAVLAGAGLRRIEVTRLHKEDYVPATGRLTAYGKGDKARSIPVGRRWRPAITDWWQTRTKGQLLFDLPGKDPRRRVSYIVACFSRGLPTVEVFTPHDLRRTFGTKVEKIAGIKMAQKLLGHENIQTTSIYVRIDEASEDAAVEGI